jgi:hypothetical protein
MRRISALLFVWAAGLPLVFRHSVAALSHDRSVADVTQPPLQVRKHNLPRTAKRALVVSCAGQKQRDPLPGLHVLLALK